MTQLDSKILAPEVIDRLNSIDMPDHEISEKELNTEELLDKMEEVDRLEADVNELVETAKNQRSGEKLAHSICACTNFIRKTTQWLLSLGQFVERLQSYVYWCVDRIKYFAVQILLKRIQKIMLHCKKFIYQVRMWVAELTIKISKWISGGKSSNVLAGVLSAVTACITFITSILTTVNQIITCVQEVLISLFPDLLKVPAETMVMGPTWKSWKKQDMHPSNFLRSVTYSMINDVRIEIQKAVNGFRIMNAESVAAQTAAEAAKYALAVMDQNGTKIFNMPIGEITKYYDLDHIQSKLYFVLDNLIPVPTALPKYEALQIINPGFMLWLIGTWVPTGYKQYGLPG